MMWIPLAVPDHSACVRSQGFAPERHGIRVQNSVFEVLLDPAQLVALKAGLEKIICKETDSIRIYRLGNSYRNRIEVIGRTGLIETGEPLLL